LARDSPPGRILYLEVRVIHRKLIEPILGLLRQGMTPEKTAFTIALGLSLGVIPVLGSATLLCTAAAVSLKLNFPVIQLVNGLVYPAQLALLVPFLRMGAWLFGEHAPALSVTGIFDLVRSDIWRAIAMLWTATMHALIAWAVCGLAAAGVVYLALVPVLRRYWTRESAA
jgi:uncharacterized protein (DUF2062 family)